MVYPMYPPRPNTERGVSNLRWSLLLTLAMQALAVVTLLPVGYYLLNPPGYWDTSPLFSLLPMMLTTVLLGIVALIFFLSGVSRLHAGRDEFGPAHGRNVEMAVVFVVIAFVVGVSSITFSGPFGIGLTSQSAVGLMVTGGLTVARGLLVGLALLFCVRALVREEDRHVGVFATIALALGPAVGAGVTYVLLPNISQYFGSVVIALAGLGVQGAIELVGYALLFRLYTVTYNRLRSGELPPLFRPPMPFVPPYYPGYMPYGMPYYPAWPVQPPTPPPTPPEPQKPAQPPQP